MEKVAVVTAGVISFVASDPAGYITGQNLRVDGGSLGRFEGAFQG